jgi:alpha-L-fucosidase
MARFLIFALFVAQMATGASHPTPQQQGWQDLAIGMFIHFAPNTWQDREYDDLSTPLSSINPEKLDTDQWVDTAARMGARYIVFVAKHVGGFCMWQTSTTEYSIRNTAWRGGRGDVVADLAASCKKRGIRLGLYLSPHDVKHGAGLGGKCKSPEEQEQYNKTYRAQLTELLTRYGSIVEIWFDGSQIVPVGDILQKYAPTAMVFQGPHATIRWVGNEMGFAPYPAWNSLPARDAMTGIATALHGDPDGDAWMPNEVDVSLRRPNWFWSTKNHTQVLSLDQLMEIYYRSVGRGANLLVNVTPDRSGLIPAADAGRLEEFGFEVKRRFGRAVAETRGDGNLLELRLGQPVLLDHMIMQEDISKGERVREYVLEGMTQGKWVRLGTGSAIGQMRIHPFAPDRYSAIRLQCTKSQGTPFIRRMSAYATGSQPPPTWNSPSEVWAEDLAGRWTNGKLDLDVTGKVDAAALYRLRFVGDSGLRANISGSEVILGGTVRRADLVVPEKNRSQSLILTVPGLGRSIRLRALVQGAASGSVLLQKID